MRIRVSREIAEPMTLGEYSSTNGKILSGTENALEQGYLVTSDDGHVIWIRKDLYELESIQENKFNFLNESAKPHEERVNNERAELLEKIDKLKYFINESEIFHNLDVKEQNLLKLQYDSMDAYYLILNERVGNFK